MDETLHKRLAGYGLAAMAAAGIGLTGAATLAEASNIITGLPNLTISSTNTPVDLSVEGLDILKFSEGAGVSSAKGIFVQGLSGTHKGAFFSGQFLETASAFPARLRLRAPIGANTSFRRGIGTQTINGRSGSRADTMGGVTSRVSSHKGVPPWNGKTGFLGIKITKNSASYFGWARMSFSSKGDVAHLTEYGLDTVPGQVIDAGQTSVPEPGTLSLLALGAVGLLALRKKWRAINDPPSADGG